MKSIALTLAVLFGALTVAQAQDPSNPKADSKKELAATELKAQKPASENADTAEEAAKQ